MDGIVKLKVKPGTQNDTKVRLRGKGFPVYKQTGQFGDMIVSYHINIPTSLTEKQKAEKKQKAIAVLNDCPTSPLKMRIVADLIRGVEINKALGILRYSKKQASIRLEKLLRSAIANWEKKNEGERLEDNRLIVKEIFVNGGKMLKRVQPAPQGRAHRIRKRSNHVTIVVDKMEVKEAKK